MAEAQSFTENPQYPTPPSYLPEMEPFGNLEPSEI